MATMQQVFRVTGGQRLEGEIRVVGAKNSVLKLMAAALLARGRTTITNVPDILDVAIMAELLRRLGCDVDPRPSGARAGGTVTIDVPDVPHHQADYDLVRRMRASICVLGPLLARCGDADVALPGGDAIGSRGLDMHIAGLQKLGRDVRERARLPRRQGQFGCTAARSGWTSRSVGATENILMAAVLADGVTVIDNAAREPEIIDICQMLIEMGARIEGVGSSTLTIEGVADLHPVEHATVPDRIVAGTWAVAAAITHGDVFVRGAIGRHLEMALDKLASAGAVVNIEADGFRVRMDDRPRAVDIITLPYPGFPTDLQPQFIALNAVADGTAMITENLFEARFRFVNEIVRLGADVRTDGHHALVRGRPGLSGAPVEAADIRAGAGLVLAGLAAQGYTTVYEIHHVERGYAGFVPNLVGIGARIERVDLPSPFDD